jgi:hypothetical protein
MANTAKYVCHRLPQVLSPLLERRFAYLNCEVIRQQAGLTLPLTAHLLKSSVEWAEDLRTGTIFVICVTANSKSGAVSLEEGRWVGMCSLLGPLSNLDYNKLTPKAEETQMEENQTAWYGK